MFEKIKELVQSTTREVKKLERELDKKLQRLAFLQESPLPPEELADQLIDRMIGIGEHEFQRGLRTKLQGYMQKPLVDLRTRDKLERAKSQAQKDWQDEDIREARLKAGGSFFSQVNSRFTDNKGQPNFLGLDGGGVNLPVIMWLLREPLEIAIREAIINLPDYPEPGPPQADRLKEIPKLEKEIEKLRQSLNDAYEGAKSVGIDVNDVHIRSPEDRKRSGVR